VPLQHPDLRRVCCWCCNSMMGLTHVDSPVRTPVASIMSLSNRQGCSLVDCVCIVWLQEALYVCCVGVTRCMCLWHCCNRRLCERQLSTTCYRVGHRSIWSTAQAWREDGQPVTHKSVLHPIELSSLRSTPVFATWHPSYSPKSQLGKSLNCPLAQLS
jgi:hypothetical protein